MINGYYVFNAGDDLQLLMVHDRGEASHAVPQLAFDTFQEAASRALALKLYGAGQDLLKTAFAGNIRGMGPGVAEIELDERGSDPIVVFAADKTSAGAFNFPIFRIFADPMSTAGLIIDTHMAGGFKFEVMDTVNNTKVVLKCPEQMYDLITLIGTVQRYMVSRVWRASDNMICASGSVTRLSLIAGKYVGKDDPVLVAGAQRGLPAVGEILTLTHPLVHDSQLANLPSETYRAIAIRALPQMPLWTRHDCLVG